MAHNDTAYHQWAQALSDDEWCKFLAGTPMLGHTPPPLPSEEFQRAWVGDAGEETFREAMAFCRLLESTLAAGDCELNSDRRLLDIGVGWGRIYRVLLRRTPQIVGVDPVPRCVELCRSALPGGQFEICPPTPPYRFADGEFDVAYLYSVFSHLNEDSFLAILDEAARVVRKGGFVAFTTLGRLLPAGLPQSWIAEAQNDRFLWMPTGGAHKSMPRSVWGWALVSRSYLRRIISDFPLKLVAYEPNRLIQAFVALEKR
jgi:SAM-dependent methyltransferase